MRRYSLVPIVWMLVAMFSACAHRTLPSSTQPGISLPETYSLYEATAPAPDRWWESFESGELNRLVQDTLEGSPSLEISLARLEQSRALVIQAGAGRLPDLTLNAGVSETVRETGGQRLETSSRSLTLASSWELDLWGRVKAAQSAALLEMENSRENVHASALSLVSEVTLKWLELISTRRQIALARDQLDTNRTILQVTEQRYLKGLASALDIYQQRQPVAEIEASIPQLEGRIQTLQYEIAVLTGQPPRADLSLNESDFPDIGPLPSPGIPADLLMKRPDIRAAGLALRATEAGLMAARAGRLPKVTLSATGGFSSDSFADLLKDWITTLAANLAWTVFDSGSEKAEVSRQEAVVAEKLAVYEQTVLDAIREVEDAMIRETKQVQYIAALEKQLTISREGLRESISRYRKGLSDYLPVLTALVSTNRVERTIVEAQFERVSQRVKLHRALGGGWMEEEFEETAE